MREFRITQEQLDRIFAKGVRGEVYSILANLPVISGTVTHEPSSIPEVRVTLEGKKHAPVHETVGMWGEAKEEPLPDYRPGLPGGEDLADDPNVKWELDDDRTPGSFRLVKKRPEKSPHDFFYEYTMSTYNNPDEPDDALAQLNAAHKAEKEELEYARALREKETHVQAAKLQKLRQDVVFWKEEVRNHERKIFARIDAGGTSTEYDMEVMKSVQNMLAEAEKRLNHELSIMWAKP
ncbi:hypothetical protein hairong_138 [Pseudomonas phage hairong]|nr:hypothetical protein hairong_138 [Pseudomonas phage hairong]